MKKQQILIVDDEQSSIEKVSNIFKHDYGLKVATNGKIAIEVLEKFEIDLILLDIQMPVMDGFEVADTIKKSEKLKDIPIIFLTSNSDQDLVLKCLTIGAKDYITKPFNSKEIEIKVKNHLNSYFYQKESEDYKKFIIEILNKQPNMVILSDNKKIYFMNKTILEFFNCENRDSFIEKYSCICNLFLKNDRFFHIDKLKDINWLDNLLALDIDKQIVSMKDENQNELVFKVSTQKYKDDIYLLSFIDISLSYSNNLELQKKVFFDTLTKAYTREYLYSNIDNYLDISLSKDQKLGICILDIDHFKHINDNYGHIVGDVVLEQLVSLLKSKLRVDDIVVRWGGEEFIILLSMKDEYSLSKILENLRVSIESFNFNQVKNVTCSFGATIFHETLNDSLKISDDALYKSKNNGRNKVTIDIKR